MAANLSAFLKDYPMHNKEEGEPLDSDMYLLHHANMVSGKNKEDFLHCYVYDHIGNLYVQAHLEVKGGKAIIDGKNVGDGIYHVIVGLEPTQQASWTDQEAEKAGIKPKRMSAGMTLKQKAKEW